MELIYARAYSGSILPASPAQATAGTQLPFVLTEEISSKRKGCPRYLYSSASQTECHSALTEHKPLRFMDVSVIPPRSTSSTECTVPLLKVVWEKGK